MWSELWSVTHWSLFLGYNSIWKITVQLRSQPQHLHLQQQHLHSPLSVSLQSILQNTGVRITMAATLNLSMVMLTVITEIWRMQVDRGSASQEQQEATYLITAFIPTPQKGVAVEHIWPCGVMRRCQQISVYPTASMCILLIVATAHEILCNVRLWGAQVDSMISSTNGKSMEVNHTAAVLVSVGWIKWTFAVYTMQSI